MSEKFKSKIKWSHKILREKSRNHTRLISTTVKKKERKKEIHLPSKNKTKQKDLKSCK